MSTPGDRRTPRGVAVGLVAASMILLPSCLLAYRPQPSIDPTPTPTPPPPTDLVEPPPPIRPEPEEPDEPTGIFHVVQAGQTLWRIARAYGTTVEQLADANAIPDPERLEVGQAIFIPGAIGAVDVPPYPAPIPETPVAAIPEATLPVGPNGYVWPIAGEVIAPYGQRRRRNVHRGIDIRGGRGDRVLAARAGRVVFAGQQRGYGRVVVVDHGDGEQTVYAHNSKNLVAAGDVVERGAEIALVGRSGNATTEHVHFEVRRGGVTVDPLPFLPDPALEAKK
ncbi:MAG TPA: M23 family metallopeptidase [Candidatus Polarisedimenticolaceae bacterium]